MFFPLRLIVLTTILTTSSLVVREECQVRLKPFTEGPLLSWYPAIDRSHQVQYWEQLVGYISIMSLSVVLEVCMVRVSLKGTVADDKPRHPMRKLIYIKQGHKQYFKCSNIDDFLYIQECSA